ncbi:MAG: signal peptidase I [Nocardioidaceae bacterium]
MTTPADRDAGTSTAGTSDAEVADEAPRADPGGDVERVPAEPPSSSKVGAAGRFVREIVVIVVIALVASALLRAFVIQAFFVPSGSMLPEIKLNDRILVSRIGDVERGEVVVFEDPGGWIPVGEQAPPPGSVRKAIEFIGVLPASGHEHLVKRAIGLPGDHVICCDNQGMLTINGVAVDESDFLRQTSQGADNVHFDVTVPKDSIFVLGDNRYVSGDSSRHLAGQDAFIPMDLVTGRAFAVVWPAGNAHVLRVPDAYDDVPDGDTPPDKGVIKNLPPGAR